MAIIKTFPKAFAKALKTAVPYAMAVPLTEMAIVGKKTAPDFVARAMTLRSRGFISSSLRYNKASKGQLVASYGMISRERFTGLVAQETGETNTKRAPTIASRGNTLKRRVSPRFRLKPGVKITLSKNKSDPNKKLLAVLRKSRYTGLFFLKAENSIRKGIYKFKNREGELQLIHAVGDIPRQEKRQWMNPTNTSIIRSNIGAKKWSSTMGQYMADRIRRYGSK